MKLRIVALAFAFVLAALFVTPDEAQAGGDMSAASPEKGASVRRPAYPQRPYYPAYDYGYGNGMNYVFGSYYRPYRSHYYSYSYPNYIPVRRWYHFERYFGGDRRRYRSRYGSYSYRYR